jgi:homocysteine S-methyltransferase
VERTLSNKELQMNHSKHIDLLIDNRVDFVLNETQSHFDEIQLICNHCDRNRIPYIISLYIDENLKLLSGENIEEILSLLINTSVLAVGINCILPELFIKVIGSTQLPNNWGFYLNCGNGKQTDKIMECGIQPNEYLESVKESMLLKPAFIGSCCGSSPAHTKIIREFLDGKISS